MSLPGTIRPAMPSHDDDARERAFDALFRTHYAGMCRFVTQLVYSRAVAEEIVQEVFVLIWERYEHIGETHPSRAYLYTAARHQALNYIRHKRLEERWTDEQLTVEQPEITVESHLDEHALIHAVQQAIEQLPKGCRLVYTMSRQENLTYQEIATALGLSVKTVEAQMSRALRLLRKSLMPFITGSILLIMSATSRVPFL